MNILKIFWITIGTSLLFSIPLHADVIKLKNGQTLELVILSENETSYTAQLKVGTITIAKENVVQIDEYDYEDNKKLLESWMKLETKPKSDFIKKQDEKKPQKKESIKYVRYEDSWITEDTYEEIKKQERLTWEEKVKLEKERVRALLEENQDEKIIEETKELIIQGAKRRSNEANRLFESKGWKHVKTDHFIVFYKNDEIGKTLGEEAEYFFDRITTDLDITSEVEKQLKRRIEIYAVQDEELWNTMLDGKSLPDSPNGFTKIFKQEIFLFIESDDTIEFALPHEMSHLLLRMYVNIYFSKDASIPLWLNEGFANFQGNIINLSASEEILNTSIRRNTHYKLAELATMDTYPKRSDAKVLFYAQATKLVGFIFLDYGRNAFLEFMNGYLGAYHDLLLRKKEPQKKDIKEVFKKAIKNSSLSKEFVGFTNFEDHWLRSITE